MKRLLYIPLLFLVLSCTNKREPTILRGQTMGTSYVITYIPSQHFSLSQKEVKNKIDSLLVSINKEMSTYDPEAVISRFNALKTTEDWYPIPKGFFAVLTYAIEIAELTKGAFDPTLGPLVNLWGFGPQGEKRIPDEKEIIQAKSFTGYDKIKIDKNRSAIRKKHPRVNLDLSAVAKGWAVDEVGHLLASLGLQDYMVEIGGEMKFKGLRSWRIALMQPQKRTPIHTVLQLTNGALATSGDYLNNFTEKGKTYSHIIDSKTGKAVPSLLTSVTVFDPKGSCMKADALATALLAMGRDKAKNFAKEHSLAVYFVYKDKNEVLREFVTPIMQNLIKENM